MSDPVTIAIIGAILAVVQTLLAKWTNTKVDTVHKLVNDRSSQQDNKIDLMAKELGRMKEDPTATTPSGPASTANPVTFEHGQVTTFKETHKGGAP